MRARSDCRMAARSELELGLIRSARHSLGLITERDFVSDCG